MDAPGGRGGWDGDAYGAASPPPRDPVAAGRRTARRILRFARARGLDVRRFADVGGGPATTRFALAPRMPACAFDGFDASRAVLRLDRRRAREEGRRNLRFRHAELPGLAVDGRYDLVTCIATLHDVRDVARALRELHRLVRPGGFLVVNDPNRVQRGATRREARTDAVAGTRFALVLSGANLLTREAIAAILRERPRSFRREVGEPPRWRYPSVVVPGR